MRSRLVVICCFAAWSGASIAVADDLAPPLDVETDPPVPHWAFAVTADPVDLVLGRYGLKVESALTPVHAAWVSPAFFARDGEHGLDLEAGYHLWPLGNGTSGIYVGPLVSTALAVGDGTRVVGGVGLEGGFQYVWDGVAFGVGGGLTATWELAESNRPRVQPRVVLSLGFAWR
jgi:hypothetical protein